MKKIISIVLALVLMLGLSACTDKASTDNVSSDITTLKVYQIGTKPDGWAEVEAAFNEKIKKDLGIVTHWEFISSGSYTEKMNIIMAASEQFDVCFTGFANPIATAVRNGAFLPLDDLIKEHVPELKDAMPSYWWDVATFDGKIYAVPNQQVAAMPSGIYTYKRLADKYNFDMQSVRCIEDLEPMLEVIKKNEPQLWAYRASASARAPFVEKPADRPSYENLESGLVAEKVGDKIKVVNVYETPSYYHALETFNKWFKKGYIREDIVSVMDDNNDFKAKKYAFDSSNWKPGVEVEIMKNQGEEIVYSYLFNKGYATTASCDSTMFAISRTTVDPVASIKLLNYINTNVEAYNILASGLEGKHYDMQEDGRIKIKEGNTYPIGAGWKWGNQFNAYVTNTQDIDVWDQTRKLNEEARVSPIMGFRVDSSSFLTEKAQVAGVISEFSALQFREYEKLLPEFLKRLDEAGLPKIQAEYQKQINAFLKAKK